VGNHNLPNWENVSSCGGGGSDGGRRREAVVPWY